MEKLIEVFQYNGEIIGKVDNMPKEIVDKAVEKAKLGFEKWRNYTPYQRSEILKKAADLLKKNKEKIAKLLVLEVNKTYQEALAEVERAVQTILISSEETKRVFGKEVIFEAAPKVKNKKGYYTRVPVGIIGAITPFNFPVNLTMHKVAPGLGAGNAIIVKPSENTSLAPMEVIKLFHEAGVPKETLQVVTGLGEVTGKALVENKDVKMITFTGSVQTGNIIIKTGGLKKYTMELGSNAALYIDEDQEDRIKEIAKKAKIGAFALAGQVCISIQRIFVHEKLYEKFLDNFLAEVENIKLGDPRKLEIDMGPVINKEAADRILDWIYQDIFEGAKLLLGGRRAKYEEVGLKVNEVKLENLTKDIDKEFYTYHPSFIVPTVLTNVKDLSNLMTKELFGPGVFVNKVKDINEAIEKINLSPYGLQAGIYTNNLKHAFKFAQEVECGGIMINEIPTFRVDLMPYGGVKDSGIGREGPRYAMEEMTEIKLICFDLN